MLHLTLSRALPRPRISVAACPFRGAAGAATTPLAPALALPSGSGSAASVAPASSASAARARAAKLRAGSGGDARRRMSRSAPQRSAASAAPETSTSASISEEDAADPLLRLVPLLLAQPAADAAEAAAASGASAAAGEETQSAVLGTKEREELERLWKSWGETRAQLLALDKLSASDASLAELALEERDEIHTHQTSLRSSISSLLLPTPPPSQGAILEFRPGVGGAESTLFLADILRMYERYASAQAGWSLERLRYVSAEAGSSGDAVKEATLRVVGEGAYERLRHEAGVHRVQRIPTTQKVERIQTSTVALVVLPETEAKEGADVVDEKDVKTEVMRSRGAGGQHVNKTESAIRLTHEPTGITVSMQDSRSQHQNREKAWRVLRARLLDRQMREETASSRDVRRGQIAGMERSDRIRTYNWPQDRVTDHRIGLSLNALDRVLEGDVEPGLGYIMDELAEHARGLRLAALESELRGRLEKESGKRK